MSRNCRRLSESAARHAIARSESRSSNSPAAASESTGPAPDSAGRPVGVERRALLLDDGIEAGVVEYTIQSLVERVARTPRQVRTRHPHRRLPRVTAAFAHCRELLERPFAHVCETGGMRRVHLRGHPNIRKRLLVHVAGCNLGLLLRHLIGVGTPRSLQGRAAALFRALFRQFRDCGAFWDALRPLFMPHSHRGRLPRSATRASTPLRECEDLRLRLIGSINFSATGIPLTSRPGHRR